MMDKNILVQKVQNLTEEELKQCFDDITEYNKQGEMGDTLVRKIRSELASKIEYPSWDMSCRDFVIPAILYEIAKRHYSNDVNNAYKTVSECEEL